MSEENKKQPEDQEPTELVERESEQETQQPALEPTFTQAQFNAAVGKAKAQAKRQAKKEFEAQMAQPKSNEENTSSTEQVSDPRIDGIADQLATLLAAQSANAFASEVAGVQLTAAETTAAQLMYKHNPEGFQAFMAEKRQVDEPPQKKGPGFKGLDAPNPIATVDRQTDPKSWSQEDIAVMRKDGTFLKRINEYRAELPGGAGGLFPAKNPMKG